MDDRDAEGGLELSSRSPVPPEHETPAARRSGDDSGDSGELDKLRGTTVTITVNVQQLAGKRDRVSIAETATMGDLRRAIHEQVDEAAVPSRGHIFRVDVDGRVQCDTRPALAGHAHAG